MIGYNEGNGHPYSFSAIINGFDAKVMQECPYPIIYEYLSKRLPYEFGVFNFKVTHVWTPFIEISHSIARSTFISNVCNEYMEMLGEVDVVIIATDDATDHVKIARIFLDRNIKVFIDKPLCTNLEDLNFFKPYLYNGQLMSCSGLRFHPNARMSSFLSQADREFIYCHSVCPVDWFKYGIHSLEAIQSIIQSKIISVQNIGTSNFDTVFVEYLNGKHAIIHRNNLINNGLMVDFYTKSNRRETIIYNDNFSYFKNLLHSLYKFTVGESIEVDPDITINLIEALILSNKSLKSQNIKIPLL